VPDVVRLRPWPPLPTRLPTTGSDSGARGSPPSHRAPLPLPAASSARSLGRQGKSLPKGEHFVTGLVLRVRRVRAIERKLRSCCRVRSHTSPAPHTQPSLGITIESGWFNGAQLASRPPPGRASVCWLPEKPSPSGARWPNRGCSHGPVDDKDTSAWFLHPGRFHRRVRGAREAANEKMGGTEQGMFSICGSPSDGVRRRSELAGVAPGPSGWTLVELGMRDLACDLRRLEVT
jgi:hypothetical protein